MINEMFKITLIDAGNLCHTAHDLFSPAFVCYGGGDDGGLAC